MILQNHEEIRNTQGLGLVFGGFPPQHRSHPEFPWAYINSEKRSTVFQNVRKMIYSITFLLLKIESRGRSSMKDNFKSFPVRPYYLKIDNYFTKI